MIIVVFYGWVRYKAGMKLLIGVPSNRDWKSSFGRSMVGLAVHIAQQNIDCDVSFKKHVSLLPSGRQQILDEALDGNFTHLLFVDDDTDFNIKAFDLLASRDKDMVSANMTQKQIPAVPTSRIAGRRISSTGKTGIEKVDETGFGFCLIKLEALKNIPKPHFEIRWNKDNSQYQPEDFYFCGLLKQNGKEIYADHDAARYVRHIGNFAYQETFS